MWRSHHHPWCAMKLACFGGGESSKDRTNRRRRQVWKWKRLVQRRWKLGIASTQMKHLGNRVVLFDLLTLNSYEMMMTSFYKWNGSSKPRAMSVVLRRKDPDEKMKFKIWFLIENVKHPTQKIMNDRERSGKWVFWIAMREKLPTILQNPKESHIKIEKWRSTIDLIEKKTNSQMRKFCERVTRFRETSRKKCHKISALVL